MLRSEAEVKDQVMSEREERRESVGLRRKAVILASILILITLVVGSFFGDRGMLNLVAQRERAQSLEHEVDALRAENLRLGGEIRALRVDPRAVERLAREELGLARPGETVFLIRDQPAEPR
jgi:cell division protein FtsB